MSSHDAVTSGCTNTSVSQKSLEASSSTMKSVINDGYPPPLLSVETGLGTRPKSGKKSGEGRRKSKTKNNSETDQNQQALPSDGQDEASHYKRKKKKKKPVEEGGVRPRSRKSERNRRSKNRALESQVSASQPVADKDDRTPSPQDPSTDQNNPQKPKSLNRSASQNNTQSPRRLDHCISQNRGLLPTPVNYYAGPNSGLLPTPVIHYAGQNNGLLPTPLDHYASRNSPLLPNPMDHFISQNNHQSPRPLVPHHQNIQDQNRNDGSRNQQSRNQGHQRRQRNDRSKQHNKQVFECHLNGEQLSRGLKSGFLIEGPIRINPKNYEEAYIPHPDGVSDICICSFKDRNRALNGDVVAVQLYDSSNWQVNNDQLQDLVESLERGDNEKKDNVENNENNATDIKETSDSDCCSNVTMETKESDEKSENSATCDETNEDDPDVIIEDEEVIDLDGNHGDCDRSELQSKNLLDTDISSDKSTDVTGATEKLSSLKISANSSKKKDLKSNVSTPKTGEGAATPTQRSPQKKFTKLQDLRMEGSPVMKNLFSEDSAPNAGKERNAANKLVQRTGKVVAILEPKHSRACTGHIKLMNDKNPNMALFSPMDSRVPRVMVPMSECPKDFLGRPDDHANTLFIARIREWRDNSMYAHGNLMRSLGEAGQIEPETEGILIENDVDYSDFSEAALDSLPIKTLPWHIPESELRNRRDFRDQCVFTIDPATARDLDDALSCEECEDGTFNVGVHIADVSYFLKEDTALDKIAAKRATSVYLVQKVIPMLPRILCEELCSLNPDDDRLTFSVVWNISANGEVYDEWFGRSIIRSCVKLSYDHAQGFIEEPSRDWTREELPPISSKFTVQHIKERVLNLQKIAVQLRKLRFDNGALRLDQVKLSFTLDSETGMPNGYRIYQQKDSNRLVEEFMLLANMAVAHKINNDFPKTALLRRHPKPQVKAIEELAKLCESLGVPIDVSSAGSLQTSVWRYCGNDEYSTARMQVLTAMCSKPMQMAKYFSTGCIDDEEEYRHYALNVPLYTHFTSPIRRYADVLVHRALAGSLGYSDYSQNLLSVQRQAEQCNDKKANSKRVQELSAELYFAVFIKEAGPFEELGMVMAVLDKSFDVFILRLGVVKRVYCDKLAIKDKVFTREQKQPVLNLTWGPTESNETEVVQTIAIFSLVKCVLKAGDLPLMWTAVIKPPTQ